MNNIYTAVSDGSKVRIYNALTGSFLFVRDIGHAVLSCVCAGDKLTITVQLSPQSRSLRIYKLPAFTQLSSTILP